MVMHTKLLVDISDDVLRCHPEINTFHHLCLLVLTSTSDVQSVSMYVLNHIWKSWKGTQNNSYVLKYGQFTIKMVILKYNANTGIFKLQLQ